MAGELLVNESGALRFRRSMNEKPQEEADMSRYYQLALIVSRIFLSIIFLVNGFGIIDQRVAAKELIEHGAPAAIVPFAMMCGRALEIIGGLGLAFGVFPQLSALALIAFLVPATLVVHSFWLAAGTPAFQPLLLQFCKNLGMCGGLLFIAASPAQPALFPKRVAIASVEKFSVHGE